MLLLFTSAFTRLTGLSLPSTLAVYLLTPKRMGRLFQFFAESALQILYSLNDNIITAIPRTLAMIETWQRIYLDWWASEFSGLIKWLLKAVADGDYTKRGCSDFMWDNVQGCPKLLVHLMPYITGNSISKSGRILLINVVLAILQIYLLGDKALLKDAADSLRHQEVKGAEHKQVPGLVATALSGMGLTLSGVRNMFRQAVTGICVPVSETPGSLGNPSVTYINDAHALKGNSTVLGHFLSYLDVIGAKSFSQSFETYGFLPILQPASQFKTFVVTFVVDWWKGITGVIYMNSWLQGALTPFAQVMKSLTEQMDGCVVDNLPVGGQNKNFAKISQLKGVEVLSFNCLTGASLNVCLISSVFLALFNVDVTKDLEYLLKPCTTEQGENLEKVESMEPCMMRSVPAISSIIIGVFSILLYSIQVTINKSQTDYFLISTDGSVVVVGNTIVPEVQKLLPSVGITLHSPSHSKPGADASPMVESGGYIYFEGQVLNWFSPWLINACLANGTYFWLLQMVGQLNGTFMTQVTFWKSVIPFIGKTDLQNLILVNSLPTELTGLTNQLVPDATPKLQDGKVYRNHGLDKASVISLFIYLVVSSLLTSLDTTLTKFSDVTAGYRAAAFELGTSNMIISTGEVVSISELGDWVDNEVAHPLVTSLTSYTSTVLSVCFKLVSEPTSVTFVQFVEAFKVLNLLSALRKGYSNTSWLVAYKNMLLKLVGLFSKVTSPKFKGPLVTTVSLKGFSHPFVVTWSQAEGAVLSTVPSKPNPLHEPSIESELLSNPQVFNPYGKP